jgi:hypothetical protein
MRFVFAILGLLSCTPAWADEIKLSGADITAALADHTLGGKREDGSLWEQVFQKSGVTFYTVGSAQSQGVWDVRGDQYCSQWPPNQSWACYDMTKDANTYSFISASGQKSSGRLIN